MYEASLSILYSIIYINYYMYFIC